MVNEQQILALMPQTIAGAVREAMEGQTGMLTEIRLRRGGQPALTVGGENLFCGQPVSAAQMREVVNSLCGGSYHAHEHTIARGYISWQGLRAGVCGRMGDNGRLAEITSICLRIPHSIAGTADRLVMKMKERNFSAGMLVAGLPGSGKTTLLRDAARQIGGKWRKRVVVVDSRGELAEEDWREAMIDVMAGIGKAEGIAIATRTLSPQLLICDEIGGREEAEAILAVQNTGVPLLATVHAARADQLARRPGIRELLEAGVFADTALLRDAGGRRVMDFFRTEGLLS